MKKEKQVRQKHNKPKRRLAVQGPNPVSELLPATTSVLEPGHLQGLPNHAAAETVRQAALVQMQQQQGNDYVQRSLTLGMQVARQEDPALAGQSWEQRVDEAKHLAGANRNNRFAELIQDAIGQRAVIHQSTNSNNSVPAAINSGSYKEFGSFSSPQVNFDWNLNSKPGCPSGTYGVTRGILVGDELRVYVVLGPSAVNRAAPEVTQMALDHEEEHVQDIMIKWATGTALNVGADEELNTYVDGFQTHFFSLIKASKTGYQVIDNFMPMFQYYGSASEEAKNKAFNAISTFFDVRIRPIRNNLVLFRIWLQSVQNARPANDAFVNQINGLPGLGLVRGTNPINHLPPQTP